MAKHFQRFLRFDVLDLPRNLPTWIVRHSPYKIKCRAPNIVNLTSLSHQQIETFVLDALATLEEHDPPRFCRVLRFIRGIHFTEGGKAFRCSYCAKLRTMSVDLSQVYAPDDRDSSGFALAYALVFAATHGRLRYSIPFPPRRYRERLSLIPGLEADRFFRKLEIFLPDIQEEPPTARQFLLDLIALWRR